jgi:hypothetical protein
MALDRVFVLYFIFLSPMCYTQSWRGARRRCAIAYDQPGFGLSVCGGLIARFTRRDSIWKIVGLRIGLKTAALVGLSQAGNPPCSSR